MSPEILVVGGVAIVAVIVLILLFKAIWRVAEPNEALIISGLGAHTKNELADSLGFKIITGKGTAVLPGFQTARRLRLDSRATNLQVNCVTQQGIPVQVRGVIIYKVGDDFTSIANAARRFLDQQDSMNGAIHELFTGHLRSIIGNLTVEDLILNRERLTSETRSSAADEMSKLGLVVDSLQIQEIEDETGYITNLGKPHAAKIAAAARIAEAQRDQEATEAEQIAAAKKAAAVRESQIQQAGLSGRGGPGGGQGPAGRPAVGGDRAAGGRRPGDQGSGAGGPARRAAAPVAGPQARRRQGVRDRHAVAGGARRPHRPGRGRGQGDRAARRGPGVPGEAGGGGGRRGRARAW